MKKKILLSFIMTLLVISGMNSVFAAKTKYFDNLTEVHNNVCFVKYGKSISILEPNFKVTINDNTKARLNSKGNKMEIIGTGKFTVTVKDGSQTKNITFFAWNARFNSGKELTYTDVARTKKFANITGKVYLSVSNTSNAKTFKINEYMTSTGSSGSIKEKYICSYYNQSGVTNWTYSFNQNFENPENIENVKLRVYFLPVGKADCIIIMSKGKVALIDGGQGTAAEGDKIVATDKIVDLLWRNFGIKKIDYLIGTHNHPDHIGCWPDLAKKFEVDGVYISNYASMQNGYAKRIADIFDKNKIKYLGIDSKDINELKIGGATLKVLSPWNNGITAQKMKSNMDSYANAYSLVTKLTYVENGKQYASFLFTGDAFEEINDKNIKYQGVQTLSDWLLATYTAKELEVDVLKLAHHGFNEMPMKLLDKVIPASKKNCVVITCDAASADKLKDGKFIDSRHEWVVKKLQKNRPNTKFVYPSRRDKYILFEVDANNNLVRAFN